MKVLVFDTETTGIIPKIVKSLDDIPYILQLSYIFYDLATSEMISKNVYIKIDESIVIPVEAQRINNISRDKLNSDGIPISQALTEFIQYYKACDVIVAHNIEFDEKMVNYECVRNNISPVIHKFDPRKGYYCTMKKGINICKIEKESKTDAKKKYFKWPKLIELHKHLFQSEPKNLHDALNDNLICLRCYFAMEKGYDICHIDDSFKKIYMERVM